MKSQNQEILEFLQTGKAITPSIAITRFRCFRLAARICDLRRDNWDVVTIPVKRRSKRTGRIIQYAAYKLQGGEGKESYQPK